MEINQTTNYDAMIKINDLPVMGLTYSLSSDGQSNYFERVLDRKLYEENKESILKDVAEFKAKIEGAV